MKTREGFVTNSSSSSFIVVGVNPKKYADKFKCEKTKTPLGSNLYYLNNDDFEIIDRDADGYSQVISLLQSRILEMLYEYNINQLKKYFVDMAKENGIEVNEEDVFFDFGGYYNG